MAHFHSNALIGASGGSGAEPPGARSIRFNDDDTAFFSKTFGSTGNRTAWTWSGWVKRSSLVSSARMVLFGGYGANSDSDWLEFGFGHSNETNDSVYMTTSATSQGSTAVFRDLSAWYHYVANYDGSNLKIYINNVEVLSKSLSGNRGINGNWLHTVGRSPANTIRYFDGYLTDVYFLDGTTTTPSSFASADSNGVWQRGTFSGSYGTNGFHILDFENEAEIGDDSSGNGNDFTPNNISDTDGVGLDLLLDFPTNGSETDSGAGGEVVGNYCVFNPYSRRVGVLSDGNLKTVFSSDSTRAEGTIAVNSGKFYWEAEAITNMQTHTIGGRIGICETNKLSITNSENVEFGIHWHATSGVFLRRQGYSSVSLSTGTNYNNGDTIGVALDVDNSNVKFYKNGSLAYNIDFSSYATPGSKFLTAHSWGYFTSTWVYNFGAREFAHSAPSGYKTLCTTNLATPTVADGSDYQDTLLYTGNGASSRTISGLSFSPDFLWIKVRNNTGGDFSPRIMDANRGAGVSLRTNGTDAERDSSATTGGGVETFTSDGFTIQSGGGSNINANNNNSPYVAWAWDAGSSTASNNNGSITSNVRASAASGFSVVRWTGNGSSSASVGHGLSAAPDLVVIKCRGSATDWHTYVREVDANGRYQVYLNKTNAKTDFGLNFFNASSSVINLNSSSLGINGNGSAYVGYCFAPVAGYSAIGLYSGNGSSNGPFIYTGFRVKWLMVKGVNFAGNWNIFDVARPGYNETDLVLRANLSNAEFDGSAQGSFALGVDFLSNGFRLVRPGSDFNNNGNTHLYMAFAENPFKANGGLAR